MPEKMAAVSEQLYFEAERKLADLRLQSDLSDDRIVILSDAR
jgi:hypothetical protein